MDHLPTALQELRSQLKILVKRAEELGWEATVQEQETAQDAARCALRREVLDVLGESIRLVARQVGWSARLRVGRILKRQTTIRLDEMLDFLEGFLDGGMPVPDGGSACRGEMATAVIQPPEP